MPDFSKKQRKKLAAKGQAMPSGGFPIRNRADLERAIQAFGRAKNPDKTKAWILKRAKELNAMDLIPEKWLEENGIKHMVTVTEDVTAVDDFLAHFGVLGMHWGQRKAEPKKTGPSRMSKLATAMDLPGHRRIVTPAQKNQDRKQFLALTGGASILAGAGVAAYLLLKKGKIPAIPRSSKGSSVAADILKKETPVAQFTTLSPTYLQGKSAAKSLPDDKFLRFDNASNKYVHDDAFGWNPNTKKFGRQDWGNLDG